MAIEESLLPVVHLSRYLVASADMYYAEQQEREVLLARDARGHIGIWGISTDGDLSSRIELCQVFLEYAMYCCSWCGPDEARFHMQDFGESLGHRLAAYLQADPALLSPDDPMLRALEQVFGAMGAECVEERLELGIRFLASHCRLEDVARRSGLCHLDLAHHGINALCRALILDINPLLRVDSAPDTLSEFMFTVTTPALA